MRKLLEVEVPAGAEHLAVSALQFVHGEQVRLPVQYREVKPPEGVQNILERAINAVQTMAAETEEQIREEESPIAGVGLMAALEEYQRTIRDLRTLSKAAVEGRAMNKPTYRVARHFSERLEREFEEFRRVYDARLLEVIADAERRLGHTSIDMVDAIRAAILVEGGGTMSAEGFLELLRVTYCSSLAQGLDPIEVARERALRE